MRLGPVRVMGIGVVILPCVGQFVFLHQVFMIPIVMCSSNVSNNSLLHDYFYVMIYLMIKSVFIL